MRYLCKTYFDICPTGVIGHYKSSRVPFIDKAGQRIETELGWNQARNQQRNWETLTQVIGMRSQISKINIPHRDKDFWEFEFEVDSPNVFGTEEDPVKLLLADADGVPMLTGLWNRNDLLPIMRVSGPNQNIWFTALV